MTNYLITHTADTVFSLFVLLYHYHNGSPIRAPAGVQESIHTTTPQRLHCLKWKPYTFKILHPPPLSLSLSLAEAIQERHVHVLIVSALVRFNYYATPQTLSGLLLILYNADGPKTTFCNYNELDRCMHACSHSCVGSEFENWELEYQ